MFISTTDVVACSSILFWIFFISYIYRKLINPLLIDYLINIKDSIINLETKNEIANRELIKVKNDFNCINEKINEMDRNLSKEIIDIHNKSEQNMREIVNRMKRIREHSRNYRLEKEKQCIKKHILHNFNNAIKNHLQQNAQNILNTLNKIKN